MFVLLVNSGTPTRTTPGVLAGGAAGGAVSAATSLASLTSLSAFERSNGLPAAVKPAGGSKRAASSVVISSSVTSMLATTGFPSAPVIVVVYAIGYPSSFASPLMVALISSAHVCCACGCDGGFSVSCPASAGGGSMYQPSVSMCCFDASHAPGMGSMSITVFTRRAWRPKAVLRSVVSVIVVVMLTTPGGLGGAAGGMPAIAGIAGMVPSVAITRYVFAGTLTWSIRF